MRGDKRERILRILLITKDVLSKSEIARRSGCSRQWVILFLRDLEKRKLVKETVPERKKLVDYWMGISRKPKKFREYLVKEPLHVIKDASLEYALTTYQAENIVQHHLFPSRIDLYIKEEDLNSWHAQLTKHGLYGRGNVRIIPADGHVMDGKRTIKGLSIVSLPQLIVDLANEGGVCKEAADMLLERM